jgi:hypothetical protein
MIYQSTTRMMGRRAAAHPVGGCDDEYLQSGIIDRVKALNITLRIAAFLTQKKLQYHTRLAPARRWSDRPCRPVQGDRYTP